jgi:NFACT protein RNA binding domain
MVLFFTGSEEYVMYMGADKFENEDLIKYGLPEDVWFHVDKLSSAHVYLRLKKDQSIEDVPHYIAMECAQLVKANSIEGCKLANVDVVYTLWSNLQKTSDMEVGQIGYHDRKAVIKVKVVKDNAIVNRITKTKVERFPNLSDLQQERQAQIRSEQKAALKLAKITARETEKRETQERLAKEELESYSSLFAGAEMTANSELQASVDDR